MLSPKQSLINRSRSLQEYVPYTSMVSPHNLRTQAGDTLTIIKINGAAHEAADDEDIQAWHDALTGLIRNIASEDIALWVHTVREPRSEYPGGYFDDDFAGRLNSRYRASLSGLQMMVNSHYLTVLVRGKLSRNSLLNFGTRRTQESVRESIHDASARLDEICNTVMAALARYGARRLELYQQNGVVFSETLEFLALLINGERKRIAVPKGRAAHGMTNARISFGVDQFELRLPDRSQIGAMLGAAAYQIERTEPGHLNVLLTLPFPFVLTQSFSMFSRGKAMAALQKQQRLLVNVEDASQTQVNDIAQALDDLVAGRSVFGEHHLSLQLLADDNKTLTERVATVRSVLADAGFLVAREDECIEAAFFAQLPGNFQLRPRPAPISSSNIIGYTGFHNYPHGRLHGNQWGDALTLLKTTSGTPFYFNFHLPPSSRRGVNEADSDDRVPGHTLLLGPTGTGKTVIQAFMLAQAEKYKPTVFTFDKDQGQANFIRAMGGHYATLKNGIPTGFNPCAMEDTPGNRSMLIQLVKRCIRGEELDYRFSPQREKEIQDAVDGIYAMPFEARRFSALLEFFDPTDPNGNAARFRKWCTGGSLGWLLDNPRDLLEFSGGRHFGFDVTDFLENDETRTVTVMYLFHRMEQLIDGRRFILNMDEFWKMLQDEYFEGKALDAVKTYRKRNALALFGTQSPSDVLRSRISRQLIEQCVSQLYLPNPKAAREDYIDGFKLSEREYEIVRKDMVEQNLRGFLFKQGSHSTVCELNLHGFDDDLAVLSSTAGSVELSERAIARAGPQPDDWLPVFHQLRRERQ
ncbi:VirB4 family type IV secretion/conjugal transfer ATPase [Dyella sp. GSA-30]|uniref:VirB4 family type IV secretion/conjugal transfer ATPase n=1 Tax=Dyella sp. GSA-30 TaxID=2994496 RepID=UPI00248FB37F|nr:VirB4 family type IV secretion/conjugal transfer ATPase [Dyella sp. GSA-30]BDU18563.1 transporter [Dyella sp. GSA-30]